MTELRANGAECLEEVELAKERLKGLKVVVLDEELVEARRFSRSALEVSGCADIEGGDTRFGQRSRAWLEVRFGSSSRCMGGRATRIFLAGGSHSGLRTAQLGLSTCVGLIAPRLALDSFARRPEAKRTGEAGRRSHAERMGTRTGRSR